MIQPQSTQPPIPESLPCKTVLILLLYGGTLLGFFLGGQSRVLTSHETLFAQPAREMLASGDWLMPRFTGLASTHKPPLTHWLIALSMTLFKSHAEWVCRLPFVLAALGVGLLIAMLATRWYGRRAGLVAGLVQLSAYYVLMQARLAEADMLLCLTVTAGMATFALACVDRPAHSLPARWLSWVFWACLGLSFMSKFLIGPAFILSGCAGYIILARDRRALRFLASPLGLGIAAVLVFAWAIAAYQQYPAILQDWYRDNIARFMGEMSAGRAGKPVLFYLYTIPVLMAPWTIWLLPGIWVGLRQRLWKTPPWCFIAGWFLAGLIVLTASAWKHKHYAIPILPPLSIITGWFLVRDAFVKRGPRLPPPIAISLILAGCAAVAAVFWHTHPAIAPAVTIILIIFSALLVAAVLLDQKRKAVMTLVCLFGAFWILAVGLHASVSRYFDVYRAQSELARRVNAEVKPERPIYLLNLPENQITYYLRLPLINCQDVDELSQRIDQDSADFIDVLAPEAAADQLAKLGKVVRIDGCVRMRKGVEQKAITYWQLIRKEPPSGKLPDSE